MRIVLVFCLVLGLFVPALALAQPVDGTQHESPESIVDVEGPFVLLRTGQVIEGPVEAIPERGVPDHVVVDGLSHPFYHVVVFSTGERVYGFAEVRDGRPLLVERHATGLAAIYREVDDDGGGTDFFQVGRGPIRLASTANMSAAFLDSPSAMSHLRRDRFLSYAGAGAAVVGAGLVAAGAAIQFSDLDGPSGVMVGLAGVGLAVAVNTLVPPARARARRAAIEAYNR